MNREFWGEVIGRITADRPLDIDAILTGGAKGGAVSAPIPAPEPVVRDHSGPPPSMRLLHTRAPGSAAIGIRLSAIPADAERLALHLAAMAYEKGVDPIILSACGPTPFETWGFRVERLPQDPAARATAEAELSAFWGMPIIIDAEEVTALG
ncbi:MAG: hypothetical protein ACKVPY_00940 [Paracoccaceae bacterium]